jgi:5-(aminomethyl)-3-furanmethanol phosphate kinase
MWVVKIGGSLAFAPELGDWLAALETSGKIMPVVVPGGATFADEVRLAQKLRGFPDAFAHRMAVLAMEQYGLMLCALARRLVPAATPAEIAAAHEAKKIPVWMADAMTKDRPDIAADWDMSSDSLAAWLARELGADTLVLVKAAPPPERSAAAQALSDSGYVDKAFAQMARGLNLVCLGPGQPAVLATALADGTLPAAALHTA